MINAAAMKMQTVERMTAGLATTLKEGILKTDHSQLCHQSASFIFLTSTSTSFIG